MRNMGWLLLGIIVTCLTDPDHNEYTTAQVDGAVTYSGGCAVFTDARDGQELKACDCACVVLEGTLKEKGEDMRDDESDDGDQDVAHMPGGGR